MLLDGRALAQEILDNLKIRVKRLQEGEGITPHMGVIRVGNDPAITSYINQKKKMAREIGAILSLYEFPEDVQQKELEQAIQFLIEKGDLHGLIVQLPMPHAIDVDHLIRMVPLAMDIDGFRKESPFEVPVSLAIMAILKKIFILIHERKILTSSTQLSLSQDTEELFTWLHHKQIVVLGKGKTAGEPIIHYLNKHQIAHVVIDSKTEKDSMKASLRHADIIISAVGKQGIISRDSLKPEVILIGVGLGRGDDGKVIGDYDEEAIKDHASFYTPTPGGVGPVNVAKLMENLVLATEDCLLDPSSK